MIAPARLRRWIVVYGNAGVIAVAGYLGLRHLWRRRYAALLGAASLMLVFALAPWSRLVVRKPDVTPQRASVALPPVPQKEPDYQPRIPLLPLSRRIAVGDFHDVLWLSPDRALLVTALPPRKPKLDTERDRVNDALDGEYTYWRGRADLVDIATDRRIPLRGLSRLFQRMQATPVYFEPAPGGRRLRWTNLVTPDSYPFPVVAHLDGTGFQHLREIDKGDAAYWLNDHLYAAEQRISCSGDPMRLFVYDLNRPGHVLSLPKESRRAKRLLSRYGHHAEPDHLDADWETTQPSRVNFFHWYDDDKHYVHSADMPPGAEVKEVIVSKDDKQALYLLHFPDRAGFHRCDLWVSNVDGSCLHELGYVRCRDDRPANEHGEDFTSDIHALKWLPDNTRISFAYDNALWIVPVD